MNSKQTVNWSFWFFFFFFIVVMMTGCILHKDIKTGMCYSDHRGEVYRVMKVGNISAAVCKYVGTTGFKYKQCSEFYNEMKKDISRREEIDCPERLFPDFEARSDSTESN